MWPGGGAFYMNSCVALSWWDLESFLKGTSCDEQTSVLPTISFVKQGRTQCIIAQVAPSSRCLQNIVCLRVHVCSGAYTVHLGRTQRSTTFSVISQELHSPGFGARSLISLCLTKLDRLAGHQVPGIFLSLLLKGWYHQHIAPHSAFKYGFGGLNSRFLCFFVKLFAS